MKKLWYWAREIVWTNVLALVFVLGALASVIFYDYELATILALGAIPLVLLSNRS
jgi:hypothetical protein